MLSVDVFLVEHALSPKNGPVPNGAVNGCPRNGYRRNPLLGCRVSESDFSPSGMVNCVPGVM